MFPCSQTKWTPKGIPYVSSTLCFLIWSNWIFHVCWIHRWCLIKFLLLGFSTAISKIYVFMFAVPPGASRATPTLNYFWNLKYFYQYLTLFMCFQLFFFTHFSNHHFCASYRLTRRTWEASSFEWHSILALSRSIKCKFMWYIEEKLSGW